MTDDPPPPCRCGGCADYAAIYGGFSLEVSYGERVAKRATDLAARWRYDDHTATHPATPTRESA